LTGRTLDEEWGIPGGECVHDDDILGADDEGGSAIRSGHPTTDTPTDLRVTLNKHSNRSHPDNNNNVANSRRKRRGKVRSLCPRRSPLLGGKLRKNADAAVGDAAATNVLEMVDAGEAEGKGETAGQWRRLLLLVEHSIPNLLHFHLILEHSD
jgi:hypothetical protein